jgi:Mg2+ and Co2+ transporter CorA
MNYSIKEYEYVIEDLPELSRKLDQFKSDLSSLHSWRRRILSSRHKIAPVIQFVKTNGDCNDQCKGLIHNYEHIESSIDQYGQRLENTPPVVTSLIQIIDSRRSLKEAVNTTKLTNLALGFAPLSSMCSLFGMTSNFGPGGPRFWIFIVSTVTLTLIVFSIARFHMRFMILLVHSLSNAVSNSH